MLQMKQVYVTTKAIHRGSVEIALLMNKEERRRKFNFYYCLVQDVDNHLQTYLHVYWWRITCRF